CPGISVGIAQGVEIGGASTRGNAKFESMTRNNINYSSVFCGPNRIFMRQGHHGRSITDVLCCLCSSPEQRPRGWKSAFIGVKVVLGNPCGAKTVAFCLTNLL